MLAPKKIAPRTAGSTPNFWLNHNAIKLWMTNPPAKASRLKNAARRRTIFC
jgi:hypothetical protein